MTAPPMVPLGRTPCAWCGHQGLVLVLDPTTGPRVKHDQPRLPDCPTDPRRTR